MQVEWEKLFKRYILDDEKTPYFTPVARLNRRQARYELFAYCLLTGVVYAIFALVSLSINLPHAGVIGVPLYALSLVGAAAVLGSTRHPCAAAYCATAPAGAVIYLIVFGFHPDTGAGDKVLIVILLLLWTRYNFRILAIARAYPAMSESAAKSP